jgi:hypothetical protein
LRNVGRGRLYRRAVRETIPAALTSPVRADPMRSGTEAMKPGGASPCFPDSAVVVAGTRQTRWPFLALPASANQPHVGAA